MKGISVIVIFFVLCSASVQGQLVEKNFHANLASVQLFKYGEQQSFPLIVLGGNQRLQLEFDDLDGGYKNYYYSFVLCDYNWNPCNVSAFEYTKGFTLTRIPTYRNSSVSIVKYTHYQEFIPSQNSAPTKSGNYILKVFLDGDTTKLAFTKQFVIVDSKAAVSAQIVQPFTSNQFTTHQMVQFTAAVTGLNSFSAAQQVKAVIIQNNRWDNAHRDVSASFVRGNTLDFSRNDKAIFAAGKEWRWLDLRSLRLLSERVDSASRKPNSTEIFVKPDIDRSSQRYVYFPDFDGNYQLSTYEMLNPFTQGDYATVHFTLAIPRKNEPVYLAGAFSGYRRQPQWEMQYDEAAAVYRGKAYLKQGYYNYTYLTGNDPAKDEYILEGNYWETENNYTILLYYKNFSDRCDQLIGVSEISSRRDRPGFSF